MIEVNLGNSIEQFGSGVSSNSIIEELGDKAKNFVGFKSEETGQIYDLHSYLRGPVCVVPIKKHSLEHLKMLRYDSAHILCNALSNLFDAKSVKIDLDENGFYVDVYCEKSISENDFALVKSEMLKLIKQKSEFIINSVNKDEALEIFEESNQFALDIINDSDCECFNVHSYKNYNVLLDGPRTLSASNENFHLISVSGSTWDHGDHKLQRIYGTCWDNKESLNNYLSELEENMKWDHRVLGKKMELFHIDSSIASGMIFWLPNGMKVINKIKSYLRKIWIDYDYQEILTPVVMNANLWEKSGHTEMFRENMMFMQLQDNEYALKPMSCPAHINVFKLGNKSYRDLPYKLCEFGLCHRYEPSGSLYGLMRARSFTQDDAHVFVDENKIEDSILIFCEMLKKIYKKFGFDEVLVCLATRPEKYIGNIEVWEKAEKALMDAAVKSKLDCSVNEGEGAFYGPKLEFSIRDKKGHVWQCGTVQVDFSLAKRLDAEYTDENGDRKNPVVVHHAVLGSLERFLGILLENNRGLLPDFVHPHPLVIVPIKSEQNDYASMLKNKLEEYIYCEIDNSNQTLGYKIRSWIDKRAKYVVIVGKKEQEQEQVTLRNLDGTEEKLSINELTKKIKGENE